MIMAREIPKRTNFYDGMEIDENDIPRILLIHHKAHSPSFRKILMAMSKTKGIDDQENPQLPILIKDL